MASHRVNKAVIPAAGMGKRLLPISALLPKELLPVGLKPLIQYVIEEAVCAGMNEIIVVINKEKEIIKDFILGRIKTLPEDLGKIYKKLNFRFIYQKEPKGLMDAVRLTRVFIKEEPFALMLPDNIFFSESPAIGTLIEAFRGSNKSIVGLIKIDKKRAPLFCNSGSIAFKKEKNDFYRITHFFDKSRGYFKIRKNSIRTFARFIYTPLVFEYIERERRNKGPGELDDVPILRRMAKDGLIYGCTLSGTGFDAGHPIGLNAANLYFFTNKNRKLKWNFSSSALAQANPL